MWALYQKLGYCINFTVSISSDPSSSGAANLPRIWYNVRIMTAEMTRRLFGVGAALAEMSVCVVVGAWVRGTSPAELLEIYRANHK